MTRGLKEFRTHPFVPLPQLALVHRFGIGEVTFGLQQLHVHINVATARKLQGDHNFNGYESRRSRARATGRPCQGSAKKNIHLLIVAALDLMQAELEAVLVMLVDVPDGHVGRRLRAVLAACDQRQRFRPHHQTGKGQKTTQHRSQDVSRHRDARAVEELQRENTRHPNRHTSNLSRLRSFVDQLQRTTGA